MLEKPSPNRMVYNLYNHINILTCIKKTQTEKKHFGKFFS